MIQINQKTTEEKKITRPPIVVVMGHIDHGKTRLLDAIRKENVIDKESGGITQHIGAYETEIETTEGRKKKITFIDTPGHEAFSKMRARGAHVADIAIVVIAADDGVKPQTVEALDTIRKANIPFIVAINKIDKTNADPERIKKELSEKEVLVEEWGGKIPAVAISAKHGEGIHDLLEMIVLVSELEDLKADAECPAKGIVIESHLDPQRGNTATLLLTEGTLRQGEYVIAGKSYAPVRIFENFKGEPIRIASPSQPIRVVGFSAIPEVGIQFEGIASKKEVEEKIKILEQVIKPSPAIQGEKEEEKPRAVTLVIKADTTGSLEAIEEELKKFQHNNHVIKVLKKGVGSLNEDDAKIAGSTDGGALVGFRVKAEKEVLPLAERFGIAVKTFEVIYELVDWLKTHIEKTLPQEIAEEVTGAARILKVFSKQGSKQIVGGKVLSGVIKNKAKVNIVRRDQILSHGRILELQHKKTGVEKIEAGDEFGVRIDAPVEIAEKDIIEIVAPKHELS